MTEGLRDRDRIRYFRSLFDAKKVVRRLLDSKDGLELGGEIRELSIHHVRSEGIHCPHLNDAP